MGEDYVIIKKSWAGSKKQGRKWRRWYKRELKRQKKELKKKGIIRRVKMQTGEYMYFIPANGKHECLRYFLDWLKLTHTIWAWLYKITNKERK
jgi:hypothetical protein